MVKAINFFVKILKFLPPLLLAAWCVVLLAQKIDLPVADIGRHIKNGEVILNSPWPDKWAVLRTNFYSYTEPSHEFVNHHWLSGVIFYAVHLLAGFEGLSVFYIALVVTAFYIFFRLAQKTAGSAFAAILAILVLPIITSRPEIRPEGFTYLFMAVFYWITRTSTDSKMNPRGIYKLFWLPVLMLLWVNLHIGFIFGFLILAAFWLEELIKDIRLKIKDKTYRVLYYRSRLLTIVGILCLIAGLVNPFFIKGLFYPLNIFREYGYLVVENQSVRFLERLGQDSQLYFSLFKFLLVFGLVLFILRLFKKASRVNFPYHDLLLLATAGGLAFFAIRNFPVFGLLFLPIVGANLKSVLPEFKHPAYRLMPVMVAVLVLVAGSFRFWESYHYKRETFGIGLRLQVNNAAEFFLNNHITGPVFNNYDLGGYLIYHLSPAEKVFTDNRPEAYSVEHFKEIYVPAQQEARKWQTLEDEYKVNSIFFSLRDLTPWGQAFLIARVQDPLWAPVYADGYSIIFLKRNPRNEGIIEKYLMPPERFRVIPN